MDNATFDSVDYRKADADRHAVPRRHSGSLAATVATASVRTTRAQDVNTIASRVHCQSGPSAPLETGSG